MGTIRKEKPRRPWLKKLLIGVEAIALIAGAVWGLRYWRYSSTHLTAADAYVTGNLTNVSPIVSGTLEQLNVDEGFAVRGGRLLARLDDSGPRANLWQAQAIYNGAMSQMPQAERNLFYERQATDAAIRRAQAALLAQRARTTGPASGVGGAAGGIGGGPSSGASGPGTGVGSGSSAGAGGAGR